MHKHLPFSKNVELPIDIITERLAVVGQSGSGKTYAAMRLGELMLEAGAQIVALDPMAVWWGLLSAADGKASGYAVNVFGGKHAHVPIVPEAGALVAEVIVSKGISAVVDIATFTRSEQVMFSSAFAERFFELQVQVQRPVHLFLEEAHTFLPQFVQAEGRGGDPRKNPAVMLNRFERLVRQGRSQGIGCTMITQRPQAVAKVALNQAGTLFAMRTMGKHERKAIAEWMADNATDDGQLHLDQKLPKLGTGQAWVASPHFLNTFALTQVSKKTTYDSSATPKFGVRLDAPKVLAAVDVEALRDAMKTVVETVEKDDPAPLRRRVAELERQLSARPAALPPEKVIVPIIGPAAAEQVKALTAVIGELFRKYPTDAGLAGPAPAPRPPLGTYVGRAPIATRARDLSASDDLKGLKKGAREMLRELAALHPKSLTRRELATRVVMAHDGGSTGDYLGALTSAGFIEKDDGGDYRATAAGLKAAGSVRPKSSDEIVALWNETSKFKRGVREMLSAALAAGVDQRLTRETLAEAANMEPSGGSTGDYLGALVSSGCFDRVDGHGRPDPRGRLYVPGHALFMGDR